MDYTSSPSKKYLRSGDFGVKLMMTPTLEHIHNYANLCSPCPRAGFARSTLSADGYHSFRTRLAITSGSILILEKGVLSVRLSFLAVTLIPRSSSGKETAPLDGLAGWLALQRCSSREKGLSSVQRPRVREAKTTLVTKDTSLMELGEALVKEPVGCHQAVYAL